ncbi:glycogen/starch/alpha-glucan phosphorylase [Acidihalobacter prosperus]|uniref:Alpha-1,4 glucan phosphorylase n=1 Tax=Acidihalobacter prosperus TaxID=160660 RepID=A0A1A6C509_9GAMM|nr:glycogen/starch/alpha-glucan phosphorylase [Acidihalobacter prosperus]OBS09656.1 maltodextrin phosphorylase [Acidihalobacter prosperus]
MNDILHESQFTPLENDRKALGDSIRGRLIHSLGKDPRIATERDWLHAVALAVRERMLERWIFTRRSYQAASAKRVYYLSMEFLIGRSLVNAMLNLGIYDAAREALAEFGVDLAEIAEVEPDAALGNGGLGRLAACILDSLATQCLPGIGYGIRYEFGMFAQEIRDGVQIEHPDSWLRYGNPWELPRPEGLHPVRFYGNLITHYRPNGEAQHFWEDGETVMAMPYDLPIPGYGPGNVNNLRLWAAKATRDFELDYFNEGDYIGAVEQKNVSENISRVLYPNDASQAGRELRLKQEYFFVSASLQDILSRHREDGHPLTSLHDHAAIQLNDTHPAIAVAELMRLLVDENDLPWEQAWSITVRTFAYTNHTLMPEALETWPVALMARVLPRHMQIIYDINHRFLNDVRHRFPGEHELLRRVSLIDEDHGRRVRMAHLAVVGSHHTNGVAALHSELLRNTLFSDFSRIMPERFINVTNGVTPRLWLHQANPGLGDLICRHIGEGWIRDLDQLASFAPLADDTDARAEFRAVKLANKRRLAQYVADKTGVAVDPAALFDVQIKRIHEYKRQLLKLLHVITLYNRIRDGQADDCVPRAVLFAGKAAPAYVMAKRIIRLINDVADVVNNDPLVGDRLKCVFVPNYGVSSATLIIPAADLSEQISTAGTEASGTGNMKLALNGALTIGTLDGANVEIRDEVGEDNIFIFGLRTEEVESLRRNGYDPQSHYRENPELARCLDMIASDFFAPDDPHRHRPIVDSLLHEDRYLLLADYAAYIEAQGEIDRLYRSPEEWTRKAMLNTARMGRFSIDRTVKEYASRIWGIEPRCAGRTRGVS